jgi:hypothetical protein
MPYYKAGGGIPDKSAVICLEVRFQTMLAVFHLTGVT